MTAKQATAETTKDKILDPGLRRGDESETTRKGRQKSHRRDPIEPLRRRRSRAGDPFPFCAAERWPWPAGIVASLFEPAGRVSTRPAGRGRSEGTGVAGGAAGGASLVTCLSPQESNSPTGARPGQSPPIDSTHRLGLSLQTPTLSHSSPQECSATSSRHTGAPAGPWTGQAAKYRRAPGWQQSGRRLRETPGRC